MSQTNCKASQHSDQMICSACGLVWDINDPEPPECITQPATRLPGLQPTVEHSTTNQGATA